jgi:imidazole glycerol-phosphate synthase subunit HisH
MIVIVDYGMGNLGSVRNMIKKVGYSSIISSKADDIEKASKLILPGVGAFDRGMENIHQLQIFDVLNEQVLVQKIPVLGICLGFQLLTRRSEEGTVRGLSWIEADTKRFRFDAENSSLKIPHMGWNYVKFNDSSRLFRDWQGELRFYFVHSYHAVCDREQDSSSQCLYGYPFTASIEKENIMGVQFHPEKSHKYGMQLLKNFLTL